MLRTLRLGEADRILHLYTPARGRINAVAKGIRRTKSRIGGRLEPFSVVSVVLHEGRSDLQTLSTVDLVESHHLVREDPRRAHVAVAGAETLLKLFAEGDASPKAYEALRRFLDALAAHEPQGTEPAHEPVLLSLQLKLHWVAGFAPRLSDCAVCGTPGTPVRFSAASGGGVCTHCPGGFVMAPEAFSAMAALLTAAIADAPSLDPRAAAQVARATAELGMEHGGFRLRSLAVAATA